MPEQSSLSPAEPLVPAPAPVVVEHPDKEALAQAAAARLALTLSDELAETDEDVHVCLTGGSLGIAVWERLADSALHRIVDWSRVHFWWSDERYVPEGHEDRNVQQVREVFFDRVEVPAGNIHPMGSSDAYPTPGEAAEAYARELAEHAPTGEKAPVFAVSLLGMGPDGHMASLFPGRREILDDAVDVLPIEDSPKPPPRRVTMTRPMIDLAARIWFLVSGADKAEAFSRLEQTARVEARDGRAPDEQALLEAPAVAARGWAQTLYLVSREARPAFS